MTPLVLAIALALVAMGCGGGTKNPNAGQTGTVSVSGTISQSALLGREASGSGGFRLVAVNLSGSGKVTTLSPAGGFELALTRGPWQLTVLDKSVPPVKYPIYFSGAKELTPALPLDGLGVPNKLDLGVIVLSGGKFLTDLAHNPLSKIKDARGEPFSTSLTAALELKTRATDLAGKLTEAIDQLAQQNHPPVITNTLSLSATVGQPISFSITATDSDDDTLSFLHQGDFPSWLTQSKAVLSGSPTVTGSFPVTIGVTDGFSTVTASLVITVKGVGEGVQIPTVQGTWFFIEDVLSSSHIACGTVGVRAPSDQGRYHIVQNGGTFTFDRLIANATTTPITGYNGTIAANGDITLSASAVKSVAVNCNRALSISGTGKMGTSRADFLLAVDAQATFSGSACVTNGFPASCSSQRQTSYTFVQSRDATTQ